MELFSRYIEIFRRGFENPLSEDFEGPNPSSLEVTANGLQEIYDLILENSRHDMLRALIAVSPIQNFDMGLRIVHKGYYDCACKVFESIESAAVIIWRGDLATVQSRPVSQPNPPRAAGMFGGGNPVNYGIGGYVPTHMRAQAAPFVIPKAESLLEIACLRGSTELLGYVLNIGSLISKCAFLSTVDAEKVSCLQILLSKGTVGEIVETKFGITGPIVPAVTEIFTVGTRVHCNWERSGGTLGSTRYTATITGANADGTFNIRFDDGFVNSNVQRERMTLLQPAPFVAATPGDRPQSAVSVSWLPEALEKACLATSDTSSVISALLTAGAVVTDTSVTNVITNGHVESFKVIFNAKFGANAFSQGSPVPSSTLSSQKHLPVGTKVQCRWENQSSALTFNAAPKSKHHSHNLASCSSYRV